MLFSSHFTQQVMALYRVSLQQNFECKNLLRLHTYKLTQSNAQMLQQAVAFNTNIAKNSGNEMVSDTVVKESIIMWHFIAI